MTDKTITASAGKPYGHVPGHTYRDVEIEAKRDRAKLTITWGSAQGYDEEHGREEYSARGRDLVDAIERVRDEALAEQAEDDDAVRKYIHTASARAIEEAEAAPSAEDEERDACIVAAMTYLEEVRCQEWVCDGEQLGCTYYAAETRRYYAADSAALAALGARLRKGERDAYSLWCAATTPEGEGETEDEAARAAGWIGEEVARGA